MNQTHISSSRPLQNRFPQLHCRHFVLETLAATGRSKLKDPIPYHNSALTSDNSDNFAFLNFFFSLDVQIQCRFETQAVASSKRCISDSKASRQALGQTPQIATMISKETRVKCQSIGYLFTLPRQATEWRQAREHLGTTS